MRTEIAPLPQTPPMFAECLRQIARPEAYRHSKSCALGVEQIYDEYKDEDEEANHLIGDQEIAY
jgi:hypothetical protein